uniref:Secreted protein n=1 Tax=Macrostomum lignano TaxID=282301 RepID=A0A1I8FLW0_9PLAT
MRNWTIQVVPPELVVLRRTPQAAGRWAAPELGANSKATRRWRINDSADFDCDLPCNDSDAASSASWLQQHQRLSQQRHRRRHRHHRHRRAGRRRQLRRNGDSQRHRRQLRVQHVV